MRGLNGAKPAENGQCSALPGKAFSARCFLPASWMTPERRNRIQLQPRPRQSSKRGVHTLGMQRARAGPNNPSNKQRLRRALSNTEDRKSR
jgi:hypothetical protein